MWVSGPHGARAGGRGLRTRAQVSSRTSKHAGIPATDHLVEPDGDGCVATIRVPPWAPFYAPVCALGLRRIAERATKAGVEGSPIRVHAPLQMMSKAQIAAETARLGLDPAQSWSCYDPQPGGIACGLCDSCRLRRAGFAEAGISDTTPYAVPMAD